MNFLIRAPRGFFSLGYRRCFLHHITVSDLDRPDMYKHPLDPKAVSIIKEHRHDIIFESYTMTNKKTLSFLGRQSMVKYLQKKEFSQKNVRATTIIVDDEEDDIDEDDQEEFDEQQGELGYYKYDSSTQVDDETQKALAEKKQQILGEMAARADTIEEDLNASTHNWMENYESFNEPSETYDAHFGTPDPTLPMTKVPCHGCGAELHCVDPGVPGYLPSEIIKNQRKSFLKTMLCQRCHFLQEYGTSLKVNVHPDTYVNMLSNIDEKALVILMTDLTELPFSVWPGIIDVLGPRRPLFVVGNKIDLLPQDSPDYLRHIRKTLENTLVDIGIDRGNIKYISLISAATNFGIEEMITNLYKFWSKRGDVYLVGNANTGKSTLFNALLGSDYCKIRARNLIRRATASHWPGTTLRMLKFPIAKPSNAALYERNMRLSAQRREEIELQKLRKNQVITGRRPETTLLGYLDQTVNAPRQSITESGIYLTDAPTFEKTFNEKSKTYQNSNWLFDTPGVIRNDQTINLLTNEELLLTIPAQTLWPRVFYVDPHTTLFVSGLGRIDYIGGCGIRLAVFASDKLSILITKTEKADEIYEKCIGTEILNVPRGDEQRLKEFPKLKKCENKISVSNHYNSEEPSVCDIVLSSAGWVSVNIPRAESAHFYAWTPNGNGICVRKPSILPLATELYRGRRIKGTPTYQQKEPRTVELRKNKRAIWHN